MEAKCNGTHFRVECKIDGMWFENDFVFPDRVAALAFKQREESYGSGNSYRIVPTTAAVSLPPAEEDEEGGESGPSDEDGSLSLVDWSSLFELSMLCPAVFRGTGDGDLDRVYARCQQGCCVEGRVFF